MNDTRDCAAGVVDLAVTELERLLLSMDQTIQLAMVSSVRRMSEDAELMSAYATLRACIKDLSFKCSLGQPSGSPDLGEIVLFSSAVRNVSQSLRIAFSSPPSRAVITMTNPRSNLVATLAELRRLVASSCP